MWNTDLVQRQLVLQYTGCRVDSFSIDGVEPMKLKCLFFQRDETYEGKSEPELLFAVDEFKDSRCPELFIDAHEEYSEWLDGKGVLRVIEIEVDQDSIRRLLNEQPKIDGTICDG